MHRITQPVLERFLDVHFAGAFVGAQGGSVVGLATAMTGFGMLFWLRLQAWSRVAALINIVPDRVLAWIGGPGASELGGGSAAEETHGKAGAAAGVAAGAMVSGRRAAPARKPAPEKDSKDEERSNKEDR